MVLDYTSIMQHLQLRCYQALAVIAIFAFLVAIFAFLVWMTKLNIETSVSGQTKLLSRIAADTPVSGFYGPGAWCTWLITLGMSQGHTFMALATTNKLPSVDYDLVAASFYTVAAAIDLMAKSVTIARLGDKAGESVLLPALLCAERVVSLGTGFSLWTIIIALCFGRLSGLRTASIALIPLIFAHVASVFTLRAHQIISRTAPVPWCDMHTQADILADSRVGLYLVDVPSWAIAWNLSMAYSFLEFWKWTATISGVLLLVFFLVTLVRDRNLNSALEKVAVIVVSLLVGILLFYPVCFEVVWLVFWVMFWWPMYLLAFFPRIGYYPPSGISVLEMDQIAALLGVAVVAAMRVLRPIVKCARSSAASSLEGAPLIPLSTRATSPGSSEGSLS